MSILYSNLKCLRLGGILSGGTKGAWERELEVATITYFRVSGLEGLGSTIISGVGSG